MNEPNMLEHVLEYAKRGWMLFPVHWIREDGICSCGKPECDRAGKHPYGKLVPNGLKDASCNPDILTKWWTEVPKANIAVQTGPNSGLVVVDADGQEGLLTLQDKGVPATVRARTGRSDGGEHHFFQYPGETILSKRILDLKSGVDTRGDGGYVILPPSNHWSGNRYEWITAPGTGTRFADLPKWVLDAAGEKSKKKKIDDDEDYDDDNTSDAPEKVTEARNIFLTQKAGHFRRHGLGEEALLFALTELNQNLCDPPLEHEEVERIVGNALKWEPAANIAPRLGMIDDTTGEIAEFPERLHMANLTDVGNAECFVELKGDRYRFVAKKNKWFQWVGTNWKEDDSGAAIYSMIDVIRQRHAAAIKLVKKEARAKLYQHCDRSESAGRLHAALSIGAVMKGMTMDITEFDANPFLLGTPTGIVNLLNGQVIEPAPSYLISRITDTPYNPEATCPLWEKTVLDIFGGDKDMVEYVQRAMGYCLTGDMREQAFFICYGKGANGKSTFLGVLRQILGDYAGTVPFESFDADNKNNVGNDIAGLRGKRLVVCIEAEHSRRLAEARIKSITGGDAISCRFLYNEYFTYDPQFKLWLAVNHRPIIRGDDYGIWRRIHLIPFDQRFEGDKENKQLKEQLLKESPGILNWMIQGLMQWQKDGLNHPEKIKASTAEYQAESDQIGRWIAEQAVADPKAEMLAAKGYTRYKNWVIDNGEKWHANNVWLQRLKDKGYDNTRLPNKNIIVKGLRLASSSADSSDIHSLLGAEMEDAA